MSVDSIQNQPPQLTLRSSLVRVHFTAPDINRFSLNRYLDIFTHMRGSQTDHHDFVVACGLTVKYCGIDCYFVSVSEAFP